MKLTIPIIQRPLAYHLVSLALLCIGFSHASFGQTPTPTPSGLTYQLQVRRGAAAELATIVPAVGEPCYTTDTKELIMGDGVTPGGVRLVPSYLTAAPGQIFTFAKTGIDFKESGNLDLFTVPAGRTFVPTGVFLICTSAENVTGGPGFLFHNGGSILLTQEVTASSTANWNAVGKWYSIPIGGDTADAQQYGVAGPGTTLKIKRTVGATATTLTGTMVLIGFYL